MIHVTQMTGRLTDWSEWTEWGNPDRPHQAAFGKSRVRKFYVGAVHAASIWQKLRYAAPYEKGTYTVHFLGSRYPRERYATFGGALGYLKACIGNDTADRPFDHSDWYDIGNAADDLNRYIDRGASFARDGKRLLELLDKAGFQVTRK